MSISYSEILGSVHLDDLSPELRSNVEILYEKLNKFRKAYGKPLKITSGFRSMDQHLAIYKAKGITDKSKIPMKSKHLFCQAVDFYDPKQELQKWVKANIKLMEELGLYFEDFSATPNWLHVQSVAPRSGKRFFIP